MVWESWGLLAFMPDEGHVGDRERRRRGEEEKGN